MARVLSLRGRPGRSYLLERHVGTWLPELRRSFPRRVVRRAFIGPAGTDLHGRPASSCLSVPEQEEQGDAGDAGAKEPLQPKGSV